MKDEPSDEELRRLARLNANSNARWQDIMIYEHFFLGGSDWYLAEYNPSSRIFFCFAILNDDLLNAEWGSVSYDELRAVNFNGIEIGRDTRWRPRKASSVDRILESYLQQGRSIE